MDLEFERFGIGKNAAGGIVELTRYGVQPGRLAKPQRNAFTIQSRERVIAGAFAGVRRGGDENER